MSSRAGFRREASPCRCGVNQVVTRLNALPAAEREAELMAGMGHTAAGNETTPAFGMLKDTRDWCEQIIIARYMELMRSVHVKARERK